MLMRRFFYGQSPLRSRARGVAFLCFILLLTGCGGEESVDNPVVETTSGVMPSEAKPISTKYFPMTIGSRWVYRNADGAEWSREVTETEEVGSHVYHFFGYDSLIGDDHSDPSENPMYTPTPYAITRDGRLIYDIKLSDLNDAVSQTISLSGRVPPNKWGIWVGCRTEGERAVAVCRMEKHETIYRDGKAHKETNNDALMFLYRYDTRVVWNNDLTVLRFPIVPNRRWKAINVHLSGTRYRPPFRDRDGVGDLHSFEADVTISGIAGRPELIVTPAGAFEDCLKIQYETTRMSFETTEFNTGWIVFEQKELKLYEAELRKELTTLFRDGLPRMKLGAVWLAPDVGPVKIERADGISELISYDVKTGSGLRHLASGQ